MSTDMMQYINNDRFAEFVGIKLVEVAPGYAKTQMEITDKHLNGVNVVHGGAIFTLADYAFAAASNSKGFVTLAINVNITYFKAPKGKVLVAEAKEISGEKRICGYSIDIIDENNDLIARFNGTGYTKR
jgi:acyl-CoA thioesterase